MRKAFFVVAAALLVLGAVPGAQAAPATYTVKLDGLAPKGDNWSFLRFFPASLTVHRGDVVDAAWAGAGTPHTATVVPDRYPERWRRQNQGPGDPWSFVVPDSAAGGDDNELVINPAVAAPSDPTCGSSASTPCAFDGSSVVNSGFEFGDPTNEPAFFVKMDAPAGTYSFVCLVHPGMDLTVHVVSGGASAPTPAQVSARGARQFKKATQVWGEQADHQAQTVVSGHVDAGHKVVTLWAGGYSHNVSADEFPDTPITVRVGDSVQILGNFEIHTATIPASSVDSVPFVTTQCEVAGADTPATSPADCADPTQFQIALNPQAIAPTASLALSNPNTFVNSGLVSAPSSTVFTAEKAGTYTIVCLVHGPAMSTKIKVIG